MSAVGVLTFVPAGTDRDQGFRNDVAELEGRLRFIMTGWELNPVFGGEPLHPGDRAIASLAMGRMHLHHVIDGGACAIVLLLVGDVDPTVVAAVVRYLDARVSPPLPVFLFAVAEMVFRPHAALLAAAGELRALGRTYEAGTGPIREEDPGFKGFCELVEKARDDSRTVERDVRFRDDLRRHHHLSVCPADDAPRSWRLSAVHALADHGITTSLVDQDALRARVRLLLGGAAKPLDPRLLEVLALHPGIRPGALTEHAVALAIRDLADERFAGTSSLGPRLPGQVSPGRVAALLGSLTTPAGAPEIPMCVTTGDDDAGALGQYLLQRASLHAPAARFRDPQQTRPDHVAATFRIVGLSEEHATLAIPPELRGSTLALALAKGPVTAARIAFGANGSLAAILESREAPELRDGEILLPLPAPGQRLLEHWPADRMALVPGRHARRLAALLAEARFAVSPADRWQPLRPRTSASPPLPS